MFLENFNLEDSDDIERLFDYLEKDKFDSLSFEEQDEFLDFLIDCSDGKTLGSNKVTALGFIKDDNSGVDMSTLVDSMGKDKLKDILRKAILSGVLHMSKMDTDEIREILDRVKNGNATKEDLMFLNSFMKAKTGHDIFDAKTHKDVDFSTFVILKTYCSHFDLKDSDDEYMFVKDIEPFLGAARCIAMAGIVSDDQNQVGKMFKKHGYGKVMMDIIDITLKFSDIIVDYSKKNSISPEKTFLALLNVLKIIAGPMHITLDRYDEDKIEDILYHILFSFSESSSQSNYDEIDSSIRDAFIDEEDDKDTKEKSEQKDNTSDKNDSDKSLANANKKESKTKIDIRKLLLDD